MSTYTLSLVPRCSQFHSKTPSNGLGMRPGGPHTMIKITAKTGKQAKATRLIVWRNSLISESSVCSVMTASLPSLLFLLM